MGEFNDRAAAKTALVDIRRDVSRQIRRGMQRKGLTQTALVHQMRTSRALLSRLLSSTGASVSLRTLARVTLALDATITMRFVPSRKRKD